MYLKVPNETNTTPEMINGKHMDGKDHRKLEKSVPSQTDTWGKPLLIHWGRLRDRPKQRSEIDLAPNQDKLARSARVRSSSSVGPSLGRGAWSFIKLCMV